MDELTFEDAVEIKLIEINAAYDVAVQLPVDFTTSSGISGKFQTDKDSRTILLDTLAGLRGQTPDGFWWLDIDNNKVPMTYADLQSLAATMLNQGWASFQKRTDRKNALRQATTVDDVNNIDTSII